MSATPPPRRGAVISVPPRLAVAAALTFAAGVIHVAAAVPHFGDDTLLGTGFMATGWAQVVLAAFLLRRRPARGIVWAGVVTHAAALGALVAARTVGLPIGHGGVEPITLPDATTAGLEIVGLAVLLLWLRRPHRLVTSRPVVVGTLALAGLLALGGSSLAVASLGTSGHGHADEPAAAEAEPGGSHGHEITGGSSHASVETAGDERIHVHDDGSIHLHTDGDLHDHVDGTVHLHAADEASTRPAPTPAGPEAGEPAKADEESADGHSHAPGEGH